MTDAAMPSKPAMLGRLGDVPGLSRKGETPVGGRWYACQLPIHSFDDRGSDWPRAQKGIHKVAFVPFHILPEDLVQLKRALQRSPNNRRR